MKQLVIFLFGFDALGKKKLNLIIMIRSEKLKERNNFDLHFISFFTLRLHNSEKKAQLKEKIFNILLVYGSETK